MNNATELIHALAQQVVSVVQQSLEQLADPRVSTNVAWIETALREVVRRLGAEALRQWLSGAQLTPEVERLCACGGTLRYQRSRSATILNVFGRVTYERAYYAGCTCGHGCAPLDEQYDLQPGHVSAGLGELLALTGVELALETSQRWLKGFLLFEVSENTIRQETQLLGQARADHETAWREQSQDPTWLQAHLRAPELIPARLYGSLDAAKVRIEPRDPAEKQADHETWRDLKVGCWYEAELGPPRQQSSPKLTQHAVIKARIRQGQMQGFQSRRIRTASATWRSGRFSMNWKTVTKVRTTGEIPGFPSLECKSAKSVSRRRVNNFSLASR